MSASTARNATIENPQRSERPYPKVGAFFAGRNAERAESGERRARGRKRGGGGVLACEGAYRGKRRKRRGLASECAVGRGASVGGFVLSSGAGGAPSSVAFREAFLCTGIFLLVSFTPYRITCPHVGAFPCGIPLRFLGFFSQGVARREPHSGKV